MYKIPVPIAFSFSVLVLHQDILCQLFSCLHRPVFHTLITFYHFCVQIFISNFRLKGIVEPRYSPTIWVCPRDPHNNSFHSNALAQLDNILIIFQKEKIASSKYSTQTFSYSYSFYNFSVMNDWSLMYSFIGGSFGAIGFGSIFLHFVKKWLSISLEFGSFRTDLALLWCMLGRKTGKCDTMGGSVMITESVFKGWEWAYCSLFVDCSTSIQN